MIDLNDLLDTITDCEDTMLVFADSRFHLTAMSDSCLDIEDATAILQSSKLTCAQTDIRRFKRQGHRFSCRYFSH